MEGKLVGVICRDCGEVMMVAASDDKGDHMEVLMGCSNCGTQVWISSKEE